MWWAVTLRVSLHPCVGTCLDPPPTACLDAFQLVVGVQSSAKFSIVSTVQEESQGSEAEKQQVGLKLCFLLGFFFFFTPAGMFCAVFDCIKKQLLFSCLLCLRKKKKSPSCWSSSCGRYNGSGWRWKQILEVSDHVSVLVFLLHRPVKWQNKVSAW